MKQRAGLGAPTCVASLGESPMHLSPLASESLAECRAMTTANILIIDDSESATQAACRALASCGDAYRTVTAKDGLDGFKVLITSPVDLVLCDLMMKGMDGFKFLGLKRARPALGDIPVIMLTGAGAVTEKVKALDGGAADYLTKPFDDAELIARVRVHLKLRALQQELREKNEKLEELSNTDELTRLANRRHFMQVAEIELLRAKRYEHSLSCILIDLDHFKRVNDTYGHLAGDEVLRTVSSAIRSNVRQQDVAARYGGEELIIVLPETDVVGAEVVAERYRARIESLDIVYDGLQIAVTGSFGVATFPDCDVDRVAALIGAADSALYQAKEQGRNRVCLAKSKS